MVARKRSTVGRATHRIDRLLIIIQGGTVGLSTSVGKVVDGLVPGVRLEPIPKGVLLEGALIKIR